MLIRRVEVWAAPRRDLEAYLVVWASGLDGAATPTNVLRESEGLICLWCNSDAVARRHARPARAIAGEIWRRKMCKELHETEANELTWHARVRKREERHQKNMSDLLLLLCAEEKKKNMVKLFGAR